jgi:RNA polymerase sigma factor (sigma-70 family)
VEDRPRDESDLVERAREGDLGAYGALIDMHEGIAFRTAYLIARNEADAVEAVQEAFYRAFAALGRFQRGAPFRPWLLRIVANEAKDRRAAGARQRALALRASALATVGKAAPSPEDATIAREQREAILTALERLGERDRLVIIYRYFLDLSEEEMALALACPRGTVKSRLSRALERLRRELEADR